MNERLTFGIVAGGVLAASLLSVLVALRGSYRSASWASLVGALLVVFLTLARADPADWSRLTPFDMVLGGVAALIAAVSLGFLAGARVPAFVFWITAVLNLCLGLFLGYLAFFFSLRF